MTSSLQPNTNKLYKQEKMKTTTILSFLLLSLASVPFVAVEARGGMSPMGMMRQMQRNQRNAQQQQNAERKRIDPIKPTFLRTESSGGGAGGVDHVVLLKANLSEATKIELRTLKKGAQKLATISGVESVTVGETINSSEDPLEQHKMSGGYNYYVRVRLKSVDKIPAFVNHPKRQEWYKSIDSILTAPPLAISCDAASISASGGGSAITNLKEETSLQERLQKQRAKKATN